MPIQVRPQGTFKTFLFDESQWSLPCAFVSISAMLTQEFFVLAKEMFIAGIVIVQQVIQSRLRFVSVIRFLEFLDVVFD